MRALLGMLLANDLQREDTTDGPQGTSYGDFAGRARGSWGEDFLRSVVERVVQQVLEAEMTSFLGAASYERGTERRGWRNGYKPRTLKTRVGELELMVPKDATASFRPSCSGAMRAGGIEEPGVGARRSWMRKSRSGGSGRWRKPIPTWSSTRATEGAAQRPGGEPGCAGGGGDQRAELPRGVGSMGGRLGIEGDLGRGLQ